MSGFLYNKMLYRWFQNSFLECFSKCQIEFWPNVFFHLQKGVSGVKRHSSDVSGSPLQETTPKKTRKIDATSNFPEEHEKSPLSRTPVKAVTGTAGRTMQSPSPLKLSKLNELRVLLKRSPQHSSVASPNSKTYVASPRRKRGGALSKEFMVMLFDKYTYLMV